MGCFLGCFGFSAKRKRRKPANKFLLGDHSRYLSYKPLDSADITTDHPVDSEIIRNKPELSKIKIKKKVSFNLNVQSYEPIPKEAEEEEEEEATRCDEGEEVNKSITNESQSSLRDDSAVVPSMGLYPANHRYQNVENGYDSYDDDDDDEDIASNENDLNDDDNDEYEDEFFDFEDDDDDDQVEDQRGSREELPKQFKSLSMESKTRENSVLAEDNTSNDHLPLCSSTERENESNRNARDRNSLLKPIENLTQWKAVKAAAKRSRKENIPSDLSFGPDYHHQLKPILQENAVKGSLSNYNKSEPESWSNITLDVTTLSEKKKNPFDGSYSWRSTEDMPILDLTSFEV